MRGGKDFPSVLNTLGRTFLDILAVMNNPRRPAFLFYSFWLASTPDGKEAAMNKAKLTKQEKGGC